ncbi:MAG: hypothetical protein VX770_02985 [Candidatus Neomarinimicrobiota bacterium]|jgi:hypothetical protein|nr:hypothetical protein [Candidatus Neomarinimicrobiota bacterium]
MYKKIYIYLLIVLFTINCKKEKIFFDENGIEFIKFSKNNIFVSKYEISNQTFINFLNDGLKKNIITIDSLNRVLGSYDGDRYYKEGLKILYRINTESDIQFEDSSFYCLNDRNLLPVRKISWFASHLFCIYYEYRLPKENEWLNLSLESRYNDQLFKNKVAEVNKIFDITTDGIVNINSNVSEWIEPFFDNQWPYKQIRGASYKNIFDPLNKKLGNYASHLIEDVGFRPIIDIKK